MNLACPLWQKGLAKDHVIEGSRKKPIYFAAALLLILFPLAGEPPWLSVRSLGSKGWELSFQAIEDSRVLENIDRGLTAEIIYDIRVYRNPFSFIGLRGGSLVITERIVTKGRWDRFNGHYTILQGEEIERFSSAETFSRRFFSLINWYFDFPMEEDAVYNVMVRSRVLPVRLYPPFNILDPLQNFLEGRAPWFQFPLEEAL